MLPRRTSFQPGVGRSIPSDLLRAMPGHWQLRELAGAYVNGNGRCLNVSSEPARCHRPGSNARPAERSTADVAPRSLRLQRGAFEILRVTLPPVGFILVMTTVVTATSTRGAASDVSLHRRRRDRSVPAT